MGPQEVSVEEIDDIDHPGNGVLVGGSILTAYGIVNIAVGLPQCGNQEPAFCVGVFTPAAVGIPMIGWGWYTWQTSRGQAREYHQRRAARKRLSFVPLAPSPDGVASPGLTVIGEF